MTVRKLYYLVPAAALMLWLASCGKEEVMPDAPAQAERPFTIIASTENSTSTRTSLSGNDTDGYKVLWNEGDKIFLRDGSYNKVFVLKDGAGTTKGTFVPTDDYVQLTNGEAYNIYYATGGREFDTISLYESGNKISSVPMKGTATFQDGVATVTELKNLCGLLRLRLTGGGTVKEIKVTTDRLVSGEYYFKSDGTLTIGYGKDHVILDCGDGVDLSSTGVDFYVSLPPSDYENVTIEVKDFSGNTCTKRMSSGKTLKIDRAKITPVSLTVTGLEHNIPGRLAGKFTVNEAGKKVYFSKSNLYWDGDSFEFEANQYDCQKGRRDSHVSYFYWLESAEDACASSYSLDRALESSMIFTNYDMFERERPNARFTVSGVTGKYRILSMKEWDYLLKNHSNKWVTVNGVGGCVIAPDGVELESGKAKYTIEELDANNLVFLPAAGHSSGSNASSVSSFNNICFYWSSTIDTVSNDTVVFAMNYDSEKGYDVTYHINKFGCSVRLVVDQEAVLGQ